MDLVRISVELFLGFIALFVITKIIGKNQISQITVFDFISAIVLGELIGGVLYDDKISFVQLIFAIFFWGALIYITEFLSLKVKKLRGIIDGKPSIVVNKGKINYEMLKKNKMDLNQFMHLLRTKDAFSIREVEYAILESDGSVNVIKKPMYEKPTKQDVNVPLKPAVIPIAFILDGEIIDDNLKEFGYGKEWLENQIKANGLNRIEDVLYAEWKEDEGLFVQEF